MPRGNQSKSRSPNLVVRSNRRATLAGPSQFLTKSSVSPVVMLEGHVLAEVRKVVKAQTKTERKAVTKKVGSKQISEPSKSVTKRSPKRKTVASSRSSSSKSPKQLSPKQSSPTKRSSPKQNKSPPKSTQESPSHSYYLRSVPFASPDTVVLPKLKNQSTQKSKKGSQKSGRNKSPMATKRTKVSKVTEEQSKLTVAPRVPEFETPLKPVGKRKRDMTSDDEEEDDLRAQKRKLLKSETHSVSKNTTKKSTGNVSFSEMKLKTVSVNDTKAKKVTASQQNSVSKTPKLAENNASFNWSMSSVRSELVGRFTPSAIKNANKTSDTTKNRQVKSVLSSSTTADSGRRTTRRQSVRFSINGKAETMKDLKERSSRKRLCYRMCQYLLLIGIPAAITAGSVLVYKELV